MKNSVKINKTDKPVVGADEIIENKKDKPTEEETEAAKKEFDDAVEGWQNTKYALSPSVETDQKFITYIRFFMNNFMIFINQVI